MTNLVNASEIEQLVGAPRHPTLHLVRVDTVTSTVYILHSQECFERLDLRPSDLRECPFSRALDNGLEDYEWSGHEDEVVVAMVMYDQFDGGRSRLAPDLSRRP